MESEKRRQTFGLRSVIALCQPLYPFPRGNGAEPLGRFRHTRWGDVRPPPVLAELKEVLTYREQPLTRLRQVSNRIEAARWKFAPGCGPVTLAWLEEERAQLRDLLEKAEAEAGRLLQIVPEYRVLLAQKGVGPQAAATVLAFLPLGLWGKAKQASAYAGLIPEQQHSGSSVRKSRLSRKGPALLRKKLYLAALVATRHDPEMKAFYHPPAGQPQEQEAGPGGRGAQDPATAHGQAEGLLPGAG